MYSNNSDLFLSRLMQDLNLETIYNECNSHHILYQAEKLFMEIYDIEDSINTLIDKLINLLIKSQDEGNNFNETEHFINHCIFLSTRNSYEIFEWLKENQVKSHYQFFLGIIYYNVEKNFNEAYKLFYKASEDNYPIAQVYLANCYKTGFGTEINYKLAFKWMQKAAENESICGQLNLGIYYDNSIGTDSNLDKAIYWYQKSANNGNLCGLFILGRCNELGIGIEKNENKAFEIYKRFHENDFINGKYKLGICYYFGIGTEVNKKESFKICKDLAEKGLENAQAFLGYLYNQAADNGDDFGLYNLGEHYELGNGVNKDEIKAFVYYKKSAENGLVDANFYLGYCYLNGIGTEINKEIGYKLYNEATGKGDISEKALELYKIAAEEGSKL
ncbi:6465_t:CDS:2 [Funneliformis geosporum]|uniref:6465_t:CDS:1 n=1 Tax=Funneliformis geosporum TaxID=1117311 RepID=A0A9W4SND2_9GLOM|nr:6465_t:CDS:2 [Funneliformis geosporum]